LISTLNTFGLKPLPLKDPPLEKPFEFTHGLPKSPDWTLWSLPILKETVSPLLAVMELGWNLRSGPTVTVMSAALATALRSAAEAMNMYCMVTVTTDVVVTGLGSERLDKEGEGEELSRRERERN